jgi:RNA-directed DNA polymerase
VFGDRTFGRLCDETRETCPDECAEEAAPGRSQSPHTSEEAGESRWSEGGQEGGCVSTDEAKNNRAGVPETANRAGETQDRWSWVERRVWTERMLAILETGPEGGKWYSLIDKVASQNALCAGYERVAQNDGAAGVDHVSVKEFGKRLEQEIERLAAELPSGTYRPQALRRKWIDKPGPRNEQRPLGIPAVRDRVVQAALTLVLEPIFEATFHANSYGFRPKRRPHEALNRVMAALLEGRIWVVDVDFRKFFDSIPRDGLMASVGERVSDGKVLALIQRFLEAGVLDGKEMTYPTAGTPQGGVISPLLANIYLNGLDYLLAGEGHDMVRFADDFVVLCRTETEAQAALARIRQWAEAKGLALHADKTRVIDMDQPRAYFDFLGFRFIRHYPKDPRQPKQIIREVRPNSMRKLKMNLRPLTKRSNGHSMAEIVCRVNARLRGWHQHFRSAHRTVHEGVDKWLRRRLRSLLRRRAKRKGISRGCDHQCWPNAFFAALGLYSLAEAHVRHVSPYTR